MNGPVLRVDLARILTNLQTLRVHVAPAEVMFVVKDDAYGHGLDTVVRAAATAGTTWFGSFDIATGLRVRAAAPQARIFAWATSPADEVDAAIAGGLELGIGDAAYLELVAARAAGRGIRVHLKIDTGLHRNGVRPEDWPVFVTRAAELEAAGDLVVSGIWSHIAEASDDEDDLARAMFDRAVDTARAAGLDPDVRHLAASAAGYARGEFHNDLVRFGAFGYGVRSADGPDLPGIVPAATLVAAVTRIDGDDAVIPLGSLDGLPSTLGGRIAVGTPAGARALQRVGLTESVVAAWSGARVGDEIAVFGPGALGESSATTLAETIDTVGEEILVRVSPLLAREYPPAHTAHR